VTARTGSFAEQLRFEAWLAGQTERTDETGELARGVVDGRYKMTRTEEAWIEVDKARARAEFDELERSGDTATVDHGDVEVDVDTKGERCPG
jgi:hypothetical protein